jgi:hypothetical protein
MDDRLGSFQELWNAWSESEAEISEKPISHFRRAIEIQFDEIDSHLALGRHDAAVREVVDIISVALNLMRRLGCTPEEISNVVRLRAERRMKGQTVEILKKYHDLYGI